jgi:uncharacterized protein (UPF0332 family)
LEIRPRRIGQDPLYGSVKKVKDDLAEGLRYKFVVPWQNHLEKARANLQAAEVCYRENLPDPSVSRAYYGVFHAAIAALIRLTEYRTRGEGWDHADVQAEFNRRLVIRRKVFPAELGRIPSELINYRHIADYRRGSVGRKVASRCLEKARRFVATVEQTLKEETPDVPRSESQS